MYMLLATALLVGAPFWEAKPPDQWTADELQAVLNSSPWVKTIARKTTVGNVPGVQVRLSTAKPIQDAEEQLRHRRAPSESAEHPGDEEYAEFLRQNPGKYIVVAVALPDPRVLADARESSRMEEECRLRIGRRTYKLAGHFPPTPSDPYLRLVFPRAVDARTKVLRLELYLPSVPAPYRNVEFEIRDLLYKGRPEM